MQELRGNLFSPGTYNLYNPKTKTAKPAMFMPDAICITTNGFVKKNGECVMGRGCALEAANLMNELPKTLGDAITKNGNVVNVLVDRPGKASLVSFPVKPISGVCGDNAHNVVTHMRKQFKPGDNVPGFACVADLELIKQSCIQLVRKADMYDWKFIVIPRMGSGAGELDWYREVKPIVEEYLDDRFYIITFGKR